MKNQFTVAPGQLGVETGPSSSSRRLFMGAAAAAASLPSLAFARKMDRPSEPFQSEGGLMVEGTVAQVRRFDAEFAPYFDSFHLKAQLLKRELSEDGTRLRLFLDERIAQGDTLGLHRQPAVWLQPEELPFPGPRQSLTRKLVTSKKEILLALLTTGRETKLTGPACDIQALKDHVGVRQNITSWARYAEMQWPNGGPARWNISYWKKGTPHRGNLHAAFMDVLRHPEKYAVGCYTAAKILIAGGVLDYYVRVAPDAHKAKLVEKALWSDGDPLVDIEPQNVWSFEPDHDPEHDKIPGKILNRLDTRASRHFVPGDWMYLWNTDPVTYQKTGYEGSNAIYLGDGRFSDYYNDNAGSFTFEQKLDDVYQWRKGVFSRQRDYEKAEILSPEKLSSLAKTPEEGGFLLTWRLAPKFFGFE